MDDESRIEDLIDYVVDESYDDGYDGYMGYETVSPGRYNVYFERQVYDEHGNVTDDYRVTQEWDVTVREVAP